MKTACVHVKIMSKESVVSAIESGNLSELQHVLEESEWDIGSEPLDSEGQTALLIACANGYLHIAQYLVHKKWCSMTVQDIHGNSPLILSFINKYWKMANFLLQISPNSGINKPEGLYPSYNKLLVTELAKEALFASCKNGYFELVKYVSEIDWHMEDHKAPIQLARCCHNLHIVKYLVTHCQCTMPDDMSEVHIACIEGNVENVRTVLDRDGSATLATADEFGTTPIHYATLEPNILNMAVKYAGEMLFNITDSVKNTPLHHSIKYECIESVAILVGAPECNVNASNFEGETPLIAACKSSNSAALQILLSCARCDLNACDRDGDTALHVAISTVSSSQLENVQCLLQSDRCDPNVINKDGCTPLHIVCHQGDVSLLEPLLKNGANILQTSNDSFQNAPIHIACKFGRLDILKVLLGCANCDPNQQNAEGNTALHIVCGKRIGTELQFLEVLASTPGINPTVVNHEGIEPFDVVDDDGNTLLHTACATGNSTMVEFLVKNGGDVLKPDRQGDAPIHIACKHSQLNSLKAILGSKRCNANQQNDCGDTALHIVCRMGIRRALPYFQLLVSTPGINPKIVNRKGTVPFELIETDMNSLNSACAKGEIELVELLVKNARNVSRPDRHGQAPIHIACMFSRLDTLKILLSCAHCDSNQQNAEGDTALHIVCRMRTGREVQFLQVLTSTPGINTTLVNHEGITPCNVVGNDGNTLLHIACAKGDITLVEIMLKNGADILKCNRHGDAPIHIACKHSRLDVLKQLLTFKGCNPNQQNAHNDTSLHIVCRKGGESEEMNKKMVELLLKNGADILRPDRHGDAPIHIACKYSRVDILKVLLAYSSCNPDQQNAQKDTSLHIVCRKGGNSEEMMEIVQLLLKNGADVLKPDGHGDTPIHIACKHSRIDILKELLACSSSCNPDQLNSDGDTALHIASRVGEGTRQHSKMVELLLKNGANVLKPDQRGDAPIHIACKHSKLETLKKLVASSSCNPNQRNIEGNAALHIVCGMRNGTELQFLEVLSSTPGINPTLVNGEGIAPFGVVDSDGNTLLHIACTEGNLRMVELLIKNGADVLKPDRRGDAPIHIACKHSRIDILKDLLACNSCNPDQLNSDGDTALHIASRVGEGTGQNAIMGELLLKNGANVLKPDQRGDAPIHIACKHSKLHTLKVLVASSSCNPNQQNTEGNTALHIVCRKRTGSELQFLQVLLSLPGINPTLMNHEGIVPFEVVANDGNILLHIACAKGNIAMVKLLAKNGANVLKPDSHGDAPIHIACKHLKLSVLQLILNCENCDPNQQNANGDTALHIVCRAKESATQFLKVLTATVGIDPEIVNYEGHTPIEVAGVNYSAIDTIKKFLDLRRSRIQSYLKVFVVGNSGNGKSTLIKAITTEASQMLKYVPLSKMKHVNPTDVPPHTAGIVPIPFKSKHFGNAVLYDFAGQHEYYSSHAAVMENLILPSPPLFLLLINISKSKEVIREELVYWWHFINNQSQRSAIPPHVILAGSHKDMVKSRDKEELEIMIRDCIKEIAVTFEFVGYFPLDCRKLVSYGLNALLTQLNATGQVLRQIVDVNLHCHILNALLSAPEFQDLVYCKLGDIMNKIEHDDAALPKTFSQLIPLLASLNDQGYILLLLNHTDESKSWVILKPDVLLTKVNGSMFAPKYFKEHTQFAMSTGVVTLSKLKEKFTEYNSEVIIEYLTHLEFCFKIKDQHTLNMITTNAVHVSATAEEYYFFPALVCVENPNDVCQPHPSINYECGWLYKCHKETEQLTTRFLHVVILRLAFTCKSPDDPTEAESVVLLRSCSVWKHGIAWWTNDGIEVIVEVGLQCQWVAVMMRCPATERVQCTELRSKVISTVVKAKTDFCPAITMKEYLIAPSNLKYPFEGRELTLYSMREVAEAAIEGKEYAKDTKGKNPVTLPQLLPYESFYKMRDLIWKFFSGDTSAAVTPGELTQLAERCHDKLTELNTAFKPDVSSFQRDCEKAQHTNVERCVALFQILQKRGRFKTWRDFQQEFSRFSIFAKQYLLETDDDIQEKKLQNDTPETVSANPSGSLPTSLDQDMPDTSTDDTSTMENAGLTPSMRDLANQVIPKVCPLWRDIGIQLNLDISTLNEIRANCQGDVRECCTIMFDKWLKQDTEASWCTVLSACRRVKDNLSSGPHEPYTKDHIKALDRLATSLPAFCATL